MCRHESSLRKCEQPSETVPWRVGCGALACVLHLVALPRSLVCRPHRNQAVPLCFLETELRPQPLSLCQAQTPMQYYLSIVGTLWSINTGSFPYIKCFVLTFLEEVRHILEPGRWSTEKGSDFLSGLLVQEQNGFETDFQSSLIIYLNTMVDESPGLTWLDDDEGPVMANCSPFVHFPYNLTLAKQEGPFPESTLKVLMWNAHLLKKKLKSQYSSEWGKNVFQATGVV